MRCLFILLVLLPVVAQASTIYKCVDQNGRTAFSDIRCKGGDEQQITQEGSGGDSGRIYTPPGRSTVDSAFGARLWYEWWKVGGSLMEANLVVYNDNQYEIRDIEIECVHYGNSGTRIDRNVRTMYEVIPARTRKGVNGFNMGFIHSQATKSDCSIISLKH